MDRTKMWIAALTLAAAWPTTPGAQSKIPFAELSSELCARVGLGDDAPDELDLERLLHSGHYVGLELGTFAVWCPVEELGDKQRAEDFKEAVEAIVALHARWLDYAYFGTPDHEAGASDLALLAKWVDSWSTGALRKLDPGKSVSLYELLGAKDEVRQAAQDLRARIEGGIKKKAWDGGWKLEGIRITPILLCPTRRSLLEHVAFAGTIDSEQRPALWSDDMLRRSSVWCGRTQMVVLENPAPSISLEHPFEGAAMDAQDKTALTQHVVERAAMSLLRDVYYYLGTHFLEDALATNLVIAVSGKNTIGVQSFLSWQQQGATVQGESRFVPGGAPAGGSLPQRKAKAGPLRFEVSYESRWERTKGQNYYRKALKDSQSDGYKAAAKDKDRPNRKDKTAHFELGNEKGEHTVVSAPFFGPEAEQKLLPANEFLDDYEDFFKAYRSAFFEWLRTQGGKDEEDSRAKFAALIEAQATRELGTPLHVVVEKVYQLPMSAPSAETDSLEWRFLAWLPKSR